MRYTGKGKAHLLAVSFGILCEGVVIAQLFFSVILLFGQHGDLDTYNLQIDPLLLDSLYSNPSSDDQLPALIQTETGIYSCLAGFRGGTSLGLPKKSWKFELLGNPVMNASHILLDAHYRDLTMMRNVLGLYLTRRLGFPAPLAEHVELYVNDEYYGVYVQVERIDEYFYDRYGLGDGPLFKSVNHLGRFAWQPSDSVGTTGFEAKRDSEEYLPLIRKFIDEVNLFLPLSIAVNDYLAYAAVTLAIRDTDALSKNFYIHFPPDGMWRFYPWDRDATFGNTWLGVYEPEWIECVSLFSFERTSLTSRLLLKDEYRAVFHDYLLQAGEVMEEELSSMVDSIYYEIRESVYADTLKQGSNDDFDEAVAVLREAVEERGEYIPEISGEYRPLSVTSLELSEWNYDYGGYSDSVKVSVEFSEPAVSAFLCSWTFGVEVSTVEMNMEDLLGCAWSLTISFPSDLENLHFAVRSRAQTSAESSNSFSYFPLYGHPSSVSRIVSAPTARRSLWSLNPDSLLALSPVRYTSFLWSIPLINTLNTPQDLSFCGFQTGNPPARVFAGKNVIVSPGDTLYLTNNQDILELLIPGRTVIGNFVIDSPADTDLLFLYPSWEEAFSISLGEEVQSGGLPSSIILSEINYSGYGGDWIELFNMGLSITDISGYLLIDGALNSCTIPDEVLIYPNEFLVICESDASFHQTYGPDIEAVEAMDFALNDEGDGVSLMHGTDLLFSVIFDPGSWPMAENILSLISPELPIEYPLSWAGVEIPGTPGAPNPGWSTAFFRPWIESLWPNPVSSSFTLEYMTSVQGEFLLYDISGRVVMHTRPLEHLGGTISCEIPEILSPGVYFAVIRSMGCSASRKFVVLR